MITVIKKLYVPEKILCKILMLLNLDDIKNVILNVKEMNVLDNYHKSFLSEAKSGFINNCKNGNLRAAQWIFFRCHSYHCHDKKYAFRMACKNGHLVVAQWLYSLRGVDRHADNDYAFRWACVNGHFEVAQWIFSLGGVKVKKINKLRSKINAHMIEWIDCISDVL